jgi:hypothetical protein
MEEFDIEIFHHPKKQHGNVDGLTNAYKRVGEI